MPSVSVFNACKMPFIAKLIIFYKIMLNFFFYICNIFLQDAERILLHQFFFYLDIEMLTILILHDDVGVQLCVSSSYLFC